MKVIRFSVSEAFGIQAELIRRYINHGGDPMVWVVKYAAIFRRQFVSAAGH